MNIRSKKIEYDERGKESGYRYELDRYKISISRRGPKDDCVVFDTPLYRVPLNRLEEIVSAYRTLRKQRP